MVIVSFVVYSRIKFSYNTDFVFLGQCLKLQIQFCVKGKHFEITGHIPITETHRKSQDGVFI